jgi:hypothetical protein
MCVFCLAGVFSPGCISYVQSTGGASSQCGSSNFPVSLIFSLMRITCSGGRRESCSVAARVGTKLAARGTATPKKSFVRINVCLSWSVSSTLNHQRRRKNNCARPFERFNEALSMSLTLEERLTFRVFSGLTRRQKSSE